MNSFKKATLKDVPKIWEIIQHAIARRKEEGSNQWQDGYPNPDVIKMDVENGFGYVLMCNDVIAGYCALMINDEPEYNNIKGNWLTNSDFVVFHRVAISADYLGKGLAKIMFDFIAQYALDNNIMSIKADTNYDNEPMLYLFKNAGYKYCGEVYFRGSPRKAYEKVLL